MSSAQIRIQQQNRVKEIERNTEILTAEQKNASDELMKLRERLDELDAQEKMKGQIIRMLMKNWMQHANV